ncbi:hypothetical protein J2W35_004937 [Variovorax boronicumulans]|uniref:hypothetical protein n=1 Tax=Variovorax boronicumulans TaxID=436515 RepID=UPI0027846901|nr:hypothetical protein [Variovorax boronicumulans]MDQ0084568.1 hypothetical protein [Variovorax boronicumulans]
MSIKKEIRNGALIPAWYGIAWIEWHEGHHTGHCLPIPLNLVAGATRCVFLWAKHGGTGFRQFPTSRPDMLDTSGG